MNKFTRGFLCQRRGRSGLSLNFQTDMGRLLEAMGGNPQKARLMELWRNWQDILGPELAALVLPLGSDKKRLLGGVEDALAMQEAQYWKDEVLIKVNEWLEEEYFEELALSLMFGREAKDGIPASPLSRESASPEPSESRATGSFLTEMNPNSAVARAYALFARKKNGS